MPEKADNFVAEETTGPTTTLATGQAAGFSIDAAEVARFSALAAKWWDTKGAFAPLHRFNPTRVAFIRDEALKHFDRDHRAISAFEGLSLLDVGCGGGLLSEPMRRMGFAVTGLDASEKNIGTAKAHAHMGGLSIDYLNATVEQVAATQNGGFDVVLSMEVIEHVADPKAFLQTCSALVKPGGLLFVATLNRTLKARALAVFAAENILKWLPRGTHDWHKFLKPQEILNFLDDTGLMADTPVGVSYNPISDTWRLSADTAINYMIVARRPA
jgi:2-polyprenyl-6-hydroxyphenyl methylase/3-demethylubiquinone-9 3-methyltransferase